jgi:alcohol dehydrogenase
VPLGQQDGADLGHVEAGPDSLANWRYEYAPRYTGKTLAGAGRLDEVGSLVSDLGCSRALVVTSPSLVAQRTLLGRLAASLGPRLAATFTRTQRHSPLDVVRQALALAREVKADCLVSFGGGSSVDTAKGVIWYAQLEEPDLGAHPLPHVAIPSTLSGAEFTEDAGITIGETKKVHAGPHMVPNAVVLDPLVAAETPLDLFLASGMNALAHCLEGAVSVERSPMTDAFYLHAARLLNEGLPAVKEGNLAARARCQAAAAMATIPSRMVGLAHALVHGVGGRFRTPHAATHAVIAPAVMRFNQPIVGWQQRYLAEALGRAVHGLSAEQAAFEAARGVVALRRRIGLPDGLRDFGVPRQRLVEAADDASHDRYFATNPGPPPSRADVLRVLDWAWSGEIPDVTA